MSLTNHLADTIAARAALRVARQDVITKELDLLAKMAMEYDAGRITVEQLSQVYVSAHPGVTPLVPGFAERFKVAFRGSTMASIRLSVRDVPNLGQGWRGTRRMAKLDAAPPRGTHVVYQLYGLDDELLYLGRSEHLRQRIRSHRNARIVPFETWTAIAYDNLEEASRVEEQAIDEVRPPFNKLVLGATR